MGVLSTIRESGVPKLKVGHETETVESSNGARGCFPQRKIWRPLASLRRIFLRTHDCTLLAHRKDRSKECWSTTVKVILNDSGHLIHRCQMNSESVVVPHGLRGD